MNQPREYVVGIMETPVEDADEDFRALVDRAVTLMKQALSTRNVNVRMNLFQFMGPHFSPVSGAYSPLDFLQIGLVEKIERRPHFLLILTEVDLSASTQSYVVALPSQLANIGIISTKRLNPRFWGHEADEAVTAQRLATLMLHTLLHLLNLPHHPAPTNILYDFHTVEQLDGMHELEEAQIEQMRRNLPREARDMVGTGRSWRFIVGRTLANWPSIWRTVLRSNPIELALRLPTMLTAAISLIIVLFFGAEIWDIASTVSLLELMFFSLVALAVSTWVLYRAFAIRSVSLRSQQISEAILISKVATGLTLLLTLLVLYLAFFALVYFGIVTFFPRQLMATWPTVDPAVRVTDHVKLGMFLASMGILGGSLGGQAENKDVIQHILFIDEET